MAFNSSVGPSPWEELQEFIQEARMEDHFGLGHEPVYWTEVAHDEDEMAYNKVSYEYCISWVPVVRMC
jgi:hypothetical protein